MLRWVGCRARLFIMDEPQIIKVDFEKRAIIIDTVEDILWYFGRPDFKPSDLPESYDLVRVDEKGKKE